MLRRNRNSFHWCGWLQLRSFWLFLTWLLICSTWTNHLVLAKTRVNLDVQKCSLRLKWKDINYFQVLLILFVVTLTKMRMSEFPKTSRYHYFGGWGQLLHRILSIFCGQVKADSWTLAITRYYCYHGYFRRTK